VTKSDQIRELLRKGKSVNEAAKATGAAYSQAHSIAKLMGAVVNGRLVETKAKLRSAKPERLSETADRLAAKDPRFATVQTRNADRRLMAKAAKVAKAAKPKIGKLRTPGLPSDQPVGACANCGYGLVVRRGGTGYVLVHTGVSAEEYLATVQFCVAVPESIVA
jgi:hypothetical protein